MPDRMEATALALDAYQQQLLPEEVFNHRTDTSLAELLVQSLLEHLARYAAQHGLDVHDTLEELHQRSVDRGGAEADPVHNFRLGAQVQIRQQETATGARPRYPRWRGFITSLTETSGSDARCIVRAKPYTSPRPNWNRRTRSCPSPRAQPESCTMRAMPKRRSSPSPPGSSATPTTPRSRTRTSSTT
ncbi:hypothetical protein F8568_022550 [Actinomadura sp. LD22]|uniref:Uncharacterized protein n=1 Tax=Actinomadura physcomitrii TaxID=2650748 RepID=A0A6I4M9G8_9ACTN|nr:hypothetical protein [Actinomadura physcomitrii]MWA02323.1 hypothetical protein [Actinomadura physcomitrii]MWA03105.1 hypothetical protein [Actinomadura physcomitrii]